MSNRAFQNQPGNASLNGFVFANLTSAPTSRKANLTAVVDPGVNDDSSAGYGAGSIWVNTVGNTVFFCANAGVGAAVWGGASASGGVKETIVVANAFASGDVIRRTAGGYTKAQADSAVDAEVIGVVESASGTQFTIVYAGKLNKAAHGFTVGAALFLSAGTAGLLTETEPSTAAQVSKPIGIVLDANYILILNMRGSVIAASTAGYAATALTNANQTLIRGTNPKLQRYTGSLSGAVVINLSRSGAISGDEFVINLSGVVVTAVNTITFQENGSGSLLAYSESITITGEFHFVYTGAAWILFSYYATIV